MADEFEEIEIVIDPRTPVLIGGGHFTQRTAQQGKFAEGAELLDGGRLIGQAQYVVVPVEGGSERVVFFRSHLGGGAPRYEPLVEIALRD